MKTLRITSKHSNNSLTDILRGTMYDCIIITKAKYKTLNTYNQSAITSIQKATIILIHDGKSFSDIPECYRLMNPVREEITKEELLARIVKLEEKAND